MSEEKMPKGGYGPERAEFTHKNPAPYVTFNSIVDNPTLGDERNFVRIREAGVGNFVNFIEIFPGKEYEVYIYFHNNASASYNNKENNYKGIALDVKLKAHLPRIVEKGEKKRVIGTITASNANPKSVWGISYIMSPEDTVQLKLVLGTAKITTKGIINGQGVPLKHLFGSEGVYLGYSALNGVIPGCDQYSGVVTYRFKVDYC